MSGSCTVTIIHLQWPSDCEYSCPFLTGRCGSYIELYSDDRCQVLHWIAIVAQVVPKRAAKLMSERFAPFVHGCATLLLTVGFVANTQVNSHLLGPSSPLKLLTTPPSQLKFVSVRVNETRREEKKRIGGGERVGQCHHRFILHQFTGYQP